MTLSPAVESFWTQLTQSGLTTAQQVKVLARKLQDEGVTTDATAARRLVELGHLTRFQADRLLEGRSRGFFFDQYKLLDLLGVGGMGWVYRSLHVDSGEIFALKVLLDRFRDDRGMVVRFEQEARAGMLFQHENIVRTFGCGSAGGLPYVVMEYFEGPSLLELLRMREHSRMGWERACDVARQSALGLHHIHKKGFVHRDIKPQNFLIDAKGTVKLLDFGLTMRHEGETGDEFSMAMIFGHECVGTTAFMAPEQAADSLSADARSDVYGLGCTLFAMLTGDTPFPYAETKSVLEGHRSEIPRNVCEIVPAIPAAVGEIVARMLAKSPADRYQTAADVAQALSVWSTKKPVRFDFAEILADRNKIARQKIAEMQKRQKSSTNAANSTVKPSAVSSVASTSATTMMPIVGLDQRSPAISSSIVRRDPFGFEHQPPIVVRKPDAPKVSVEKYSAGAINSQMALLPPNGGAAIPLLKDRFVIGRNHDCDLQIQDGSVSSRHCELKYDGQSWTLNDLNSRNGVRVNGENVITRTLQPGDTIIVGSSLRLKFIDRSGKSGFFASDRKRLMAAVALAVAALVTIAVFMSLWPPR